MPRRVFYSFYYEDDHDRVQQVKNMGRVESQPLLTGNKWEEVRQGGDAAIKRWINDQMSGKTCLVCLVGSQTASRPWVHHEILKAWNDGLGVVGIRIHGLKGLDQKTSSIGANPFEKINVKGSPMTGIVKLFNPSGIDSKGIYASINNNIESLVEEAIKTRGRY